MLVVLLVLPGFLFYRAYRIAEAASPDAPVLPGVTAAFLWSLSAALFLHLGASQLVDWFTPWRVDYAQVLFLLSGAFANGEQLSAALGSVAARRWEIGVYLILTCFGSYCLGRAAFWAARRTGLEAAIVAGGVGEYWHSLFSGTFYQTHSDISEGRPDLVNVAATIELGGEVYVYEGIIERYVVEEDGKLDRLLLSNVTRWRVANGVVQDEFSMPGEYFSLDCRNIQTLDVDYFYLGDESATENEQAQEQEIRWIDGSDERAIK